MTRKTDITIFHLIRKNAMAGRKIIYTWPDRQIDRSRKIVQQALDPDHQIAALEAFRQAFIRHFSRKEQGQ